MSLALLKITFETKKDSIFNTIKTHIVHAVTIIIVTSSHFTNSTICQLTCRRYHGYTNCRHVKWCDSLFCFIASLKILNKLPIPCIIFLYCPHRYQLHFLNDSQIITFSICTLSYHHIILIHVTNFNLIYYSSAYTPSCISSSIYVNILDNLPVLIYNWYISTYFYSCTIHI